jgi:hypothetical protein
MPHGGAVEDHSMPDRTVPTSDRLAHAPWHTRRAVAQEGTQSAPLGRALTVRQRATVMDQAFAYIRAVAFEYRRAIEAANRYEQLRLKRRACDDPDAHPARRVYLEFYSGK